MLREIMDIYNSNWNQILVWSLLIIFPVTSLSFLFLIYFNWSEDVLIPEYLSGFAVFINFIICIPPFMEMVIKTKHDEVINASEGLVVFVKQFGLLFISTIVLYFIVIVGVSFLLIPTFIALLFLLVFPFFSDSKSVKAVFLKTMHTIKRENFALIGDLLIIFSVNIACWGITMIFLSQFENNVLSFIIIRNLLNICMFPFLYIYLTLRYRKDVYEYVH